MRRTRKHIRLRDFDYSSESAYFITFNIKYRLKILCKIIDETVVLSDIGQIADDCLLAIPNHFANAELDEYCIMPDHIHCILFLIRPPDGLNIGTKHIIAPQTKKQDTSQEKDQGSQTEQYNKFGRPVKGSVSVIIQQFKSSVTRECNKKGLGKITWQGRFHDHVIRSYDEYLRIKEYIINNPSNWKQGHHM